jgi:hypothetical protein
MLLHQLSRLRWSIPFFASTHVHPQLNLCKTRPYYSEDFHPTPHTVTPLSKCNSVVHSHFSAPCGHKSRITYRCSLIHSTNWVAAMLQVKVGHLQLTFQSRSAKTLILDELIFGNITENWILNFTRIFRLTLFCTCRCDNIIYIQLTLT